uniref:Uncharacterized protein n=1 Tax=Panagrolaimus sp. JU765 TaxID=591449 RepID=A0AC34R3W8_9BILA
MSLIRTVILRTSPHIAQTKRFTPTAIRSLCLTRCQRFEQTRYLHVSTSLNAKKDYYKILGVAKNAKDTDIKKAYYQAAKKYHPDVNKEKGASEKFQELSEAYEVLSDADKRAAYDQNSQRPSGKHSDWQYQSTRAAEEIFNQFFGGLGRDPFAGFAESAAGFAASQEIPVNLSFEEAARGASKTISYNSIEDCIKCRGSGTEPGYKKVSCPYCNGTGVTSSSYSGFYFQSTCNRCRGSGHYNKNPCTECEGHGTSVQRRSSTVSIPAGVSNGQRMQLSLGRNTVYLLLRVADSLIHQRDRYDIHTDVDISIAQAILGGTVKVSGIYEDRYVQIRPGTNSHTEYLIPGAGIKKLDKSGTGDQHIHIKIKVPKKLTEKQKALMLAWAELENDTSGTVDGIAKTVDGLKKSTDDKTSEIIKELRRILYEETSGTPVDPPKAATEAKEDKKKSSSSA